LGRRARTALLNENSCEIPIETVKSIDELTCSLDPATIAAPHALAAKLIDTTVLVSDAIAGQEEDFAKIAVHRVIWGMSRFNSLTAASSAE
jgi:hypothetical protein